MSDLTLRRRILDELEFLPHIDAGAIGVTLKNGVVVLTGHVKTYAEKIAVECAVQAIKGVLALAEELDASKIRVTVHGNQVTLEGTVTQWCERKAVEQTAWAVAGVSYVENHLLID